MLRNAIFRLRHLCLFGEITQQYLFVCLKLIRESLKLPKQVRDLHDIDIPAGFLEFHPEILVIDILLHMRTEARQLSPCVYSD